MLNSSFSKNSLYKKFVLSMVICLVIPIFIVLILIFVKLSKDNTEIGRIMGEQIATHMEMQAKSKIQDVEELVRNIATYGKLLDFLEAPYENMSNLENYYNLANSYIIASAKADEDTRIQVYMTNSSIPVGYGAFYQMSELQHSKVINNFIDSSEISEWFSEDDFFGSKALGDFFVPTKDNFIYIKKLFQPSGEFLGIIVAATERQHFIFPPNEYRERNIQVLEEADIFLLNLGEETIKEEQLTDIVGFKSSEKYNHSLVTIKKLDNFPLRFIVLSSQDKSFRIFMMIVLTIIIFILSAMIFLIRFIHSIFNRLNGYISGITPCITYGNFNERLDIKDDNELSAVARNINLLLDKIDCLIKTTMEQEVISRESRFIALQHQINPHFIYNTMETFSDQMEANGLFEESEAMVSFAKMFRYNVSADSKFSTVKAELEQAKNYIDINKIRYPDLELICDVPETIIEMKIIRFILQPLVENCVLHGINRKTGIRISIVATKLEDKVLFRILDNGAGIECSEVERLNQMFLTKKPINNYKGEDGIGLYNINLRLQLFYGEKCILKVQSVLGEWTLLSFEVPQECPADVQAIDDAHIR